MLDRDRVCDVKLAYEWGLVRAITEIGFQTIQSSCYFYTEKLQLSADLSQTPIHSDTRHATQINSARVFTGSQP